MIRLRSAGKTDVGLKRTQNEDNFIMLPDQGLYVLADGMGGHASGKVASTLCVTLITEFICVKAKAPDFSFEYPPDDRLPYEANVLVNAIKFANERIFIESCKDRSMEGMGTTVTAILATPDSLVLAHVGDSRIYRLRGGDLAQMTEDHSLLNHLIGTGEIKREEAHKFANKNVILRAIGLKDYVEVTAQVVAKVPGDIYMMCSDGLSDLVEHFVLKEVLRTAPNLPDACDQLIKLALHAGGKDNVTAVCVEVEEVASTGDARWSTGTFAPIRPAEEHARPAAPSAPPPRPVAQPAPAPPQQDYQAPERLHAVRRRASEAPPVRRPSMPPPPGQQRDRERRGTPWTPDAHRPRQGSTPPAPMEPVGGFDAAPAESRPRPPGHLAGGHSGSFQAPPPGAYQPPSGAYPSQTNSGSFPAPGALAQQRRRRTPNDMPAYQAPAGQGAPAAPPPPGSFAQPHGDATPPPPGMFANRGDAASPPQTHSAGYVPPPGALRQAPRPERPTTPATPRASREIDDESETTNIDMAVVDDPEEAKPTVMEFPVYVPPTAPAAPGRLVPEIGQAMSGEGTIDTIDDETPDYAGSGSIMVDSSLYDEPVGSIVIDESLLVESEQHRKKPPPLPGRNPGSGQQPQEPNRPTELLPSTGRKP